MPDFAPILSYHPACGASIVFAIALGLLVGSFLSVVIHRLPVMLERAWRADMNPGDDPSDGRPLRYNLCLPRSACPHCGYPLRAWENIPLASWLMLRGRCSQCRVRISLRYPLIELACAAFSVGALIEFGMTGKALAALGLCATLLAASAIDLDRQLLPDVLTLPLLWAGLAVNLGQTFCSLQSAVLGAMAGYVSLWCVYWLFRLLRGIDGMGYGDFKLLAALGAWLGWAALPQIVAIAALLGTVVGLVAMALKRMRFTEPFPFGPHLAVGAVLTLFCGTLYPAWIL